MLHGICIGVYAFVSYTRVELRGGRAGHESVEPLTCCVTLGKSLNLIMLTVEEGVVLGIKTFFFSWEQAPELMSHC